MKKVKKVSVVFFLMLAMFMFGIGITSINYGTQINATAQTTGLENAETTGGEQMLIRQK